MGIGGIGIWQILILLIVILLVFGGTKRIKSLGSDLANTIKSFRTVSYTHLTLPTKRKV